VNASYARYLLGVLVLVYVFNFVDRQIPAILAERIKGDLGASDAQLGYLYGTAFAVFYALFGIPLGRLADVWDRRKLIAIGLGFWSLMTAVSGFASTFTQLAVARVGVGIGEASATPAAFSLISDYFPRQRRASALAIYSSGIYIGIGLGLFIGGVVAQNWGWRAAFFVVGPPGLLLAAWVATLREPRRGESEGLASPAHPQPWRAFLTELAAVLPPFTFFHLLRLGASPGALVSNLAGAATAAALAWLLSAALGTPAQWWSLVVGVYAALSWAQSIVLRDRPAAVLIFGTRSLRLATLGFACVSFSGYGLSFWLAPFFARVHGLPLDRVGLLVGGSAAIGGWLGVMLGGLLADRWRRTSATGRLRVGLLNAIVPIPLALATLWVPDTRLALALSLPLNVAAALWLGPGASTVQDLVLPRMRALASAAYLLAITLISLALGPYLIGRISMATGDLRLALSLGFVSNLAAVACFLWAGRTLERDEATRLERARAAGEA